MHIRICYLKEEATHIIRPTMKVLFLCLAVVALASACVQPEICTVACAPCPATRPKASCLGTICKCKATGCRIQVGFTNQSVFALFSKYFR